MTLPRRKKRVSTKPADPDKVDSKGHLGWIRKRFDCAVAHRVGAADGQRINCGGAMQAHHVTTRGAGGGDDTAVPMCALHHEQIHHMGTASFQALYGVDLHGMAADLWHSDAYHRGQWIRKQKEMVG